MADTNQNAKLFAELFGKNTNIVVGSIGSQTAAGTIAQIQTAAGAIAANTLRDMKPGVVLLFQASNGLWYCVNADQKATEVISSDTIYKRKTTVSTKLPAAGKVKVLYFIHEGGKINFYIGGDREEPKKVFTIPAVMEDGQHQYLPNIYGFINSTGRGADSWIVQLKYAYVALRWRESQAKQFEIYRTNFQWWIVEDTIRKKARIRAELGLIVPLEDLCVDPIMPRVETAGPVFGGYMTYSDPAIDRGDKYPRYYAVTITPEQQWKVEGAMAAALEPVGYGFWTANGDVIFPDHVNLEDYDDVGFQLFSDIDTYGYPNIKIEEVPLEASFPVGSTIVFYTPGKARVAIGAPTLTLKLSSVFPPFLESSMTTSRRYPVPYSLNILAGVNDLSIEGGGECAAMSLFKSTEPQIDKGSWKIKWTSVNNYHPDPPATTEIGGTFRGGKIQAAASVSGSSKISSKFFPLPDRPAEDGLIYDYQYTSPTDPRNGFSTVSRVLIVNDKLTKSLVMRTENEEHVTVGFGAFKYIRRAFIRMFQRHPLLATYYALGTNNDVFWGEYRHWPYTLSLDTFIFAYLGQDGENISYPQYHVIDPLGNNYIHYENPIPVNGYRGNLALIFSVNPSISRLPLGGFYGTILRFVYPDGTIPTESIVANAGGQLVNYPVRIGFARRYFAKAIVQPHPYADQLEYNIAGLYTSVLGSEVYLSKKDQFKGLPDWYQLAPLSGIWEASVFGTTPWVTYAEAFGLTIYPPLPPNPLVIETKKLKLYKALDSQTLDTPIDLPDNEQTKALMSRIDRRYTSFIDDTIYTASIDQEERLWQPGKTYQAGDSVIWIAERETQTNFPSGDPVNRPQDAEKARVLVKYSIDSSQGGLSETRTKTDISSLSFTVTNTEGQPITITEQNRIQSVKWVKYVALQTTSSAPPSGEWESAPSGLGTSTGRVTIQVNKITSAGVVENPTYVSTPLLPLKGLTPERRIYESIWPPFDLNWVYLASPGNPELGLPPSAPIKPVYDVFDETQQFILSLSYHP